MKGYITYVARAREAALGIDAGVLARAVPVVGHALVNVVAVRAVRAVAVGALAGVRAGLVAALVRAAAVVLRALVHVLTLGHVDQPVALVAEAGRHAAVGQPTLVLAAVVLGADLGRASLTRRRVIFKYVRVTVTLKRNKKASLLPGSSSQYGCTPIQPCCWQNMKPRLPSLSR